MAEDDEDADLLDAWRSGDKAAGEAFYERGFERVDRFFRTKVDEIAVEDLVQRTFEACLGSREPFARRSKVSTYLLGIAINLLRRHYRDDHPERREPLDELSIADLGYTPSEVLTARREGRILLEALRRLTLDQQIVIELYYWEDLNRREIAELLEIPEGTVGTRLRDGKLRLERLMKELLESSERLRSTVTTLDDWMQQVRDRLKEPKG